MIHFQQSLFDTLLSAPFIYAKCTRTLLYVTVYEKTRHMGFFEKFEFDASLISPTLGLTRVQVLDRSRASLWSYCALFAIAPHPQ
jgi:hypothetical protein